MNYTRDAELRLEEIRKGADHAGDIMGQQGGYVLKLAGKLDALTAERDAAIRKLSEEGKKRGAVEAERDELQRRLAEVLAIINPGLLPNALSRHRSEREVLYQRALAIAEGREDE